MKLYRVIVVDDTFDERSKHFWYGTQIEWRSGIKALKAQNYEIVSSEPVDVPTDKKGLLAWLNSREVQP